MFIRSICSTVLIFFAFSIVIDCTSDPWVKWNVGKGLGGSSEVFGYKFDGPIERGLVKAWRWGSSGGKVTDCNSNCRYYHQRGGQCTPSGSNDCSTDCGCGSVCRCL